MRTAIIGGGAAGFFLAINLKEMHPDMEVVIFEKSKRVLAKVEVSGGGRCNCTNSFEAVKDLSSVYPRGHRLMKRLFNIFDYHDAYQWFEQHGVRLTTQEDGCVFPASQRSLSIIHCFRSEASRLGIHVCTESKITSLDQLSDYDFIAVTTGGSPRNESLQWLSCKGVATVEPVPSLFTFSIADEQLRALMGTVANDATVFIPGTRLRASGALLITHWGMSGPAVLRLSSYAARELHEHQYQMPLAVNWSSRSDANIVDQLYAIVHDQPLRQVTSVRPFGLPARLWTYLAAKAIGPRSCGSWMSLNQKEKNRLVNILSNDTYQITGRAAFKDEFVTCGGVSLSAVSPQSLESKALPHVFFAGEVLDIDGITGGFNFQAAWTTAYTVAKAISASVS